MAENYDEGMQAADAAQVERIAAELRTPEKLDPSFEDRLMERVRMEGPALYPARSSHVSWWRTERVFRLSPITGLALAAGISAVIALSGVAIGSRISTPSSGISRTALSPVGRDTVRLVRFVFVDSGAPLGPLLQTAAEFDLNVQLRRLMESENPPLAEIESRLREAADERVTIEETTLMSLQQAVERAAFRFRERPNDLDRLETYQALVELVRKAQLRVDLRQPQNAYYTMMGTVRPVVASDGKHAESKRWLELFDALGEKLSISPEAET